MSNEPTVIANQAHLPGLAMPGEYEVEFDTETGQTTVIAGPQKGKTFLPDPAVVDAMRRALKSGEVVNESVETYVETPEQ